MAYIPTIVGSPCMSLNLSWKSQFRMGSRTLAFRSDRHLDPSRNPSQPNRQEAPPPPPNPSTQFPVPCTHKTNEHTLVLSSSQSQLFSAQRLQTPKACSHLLASVTDHRIVGGRILGGLVWRSEFQNQPTNVPKCYIRYTTQYMLCTTN